MFKKAFKISSKNNLSGKDRKKLVADLSKYYDPESVSFLLEKNNPTIIVHKIQGSKGVIYLIDDIPVLVDASGKGDVFPSLYTLQQYPKFSRAVDIKQGVESFLLGGANLMWPGVRNLKEIGPFNKDDVRYVRTTENQIVAVGLMACSLAELVANGPTGNALIVLHVFDDKLWGIGPKKILSPIFGEEKPQEVGVKEGESVNENEEAKQEEAKPVDENEALEEQKVEKEDNDSESDKEEEKDGEEQVSPEVMDEYLTEAFLTALKISLDDKDLPMDGGEFYSNHLLPCKREGVFIDLKKSSYKKISKFLQAMSKAGIIDFKESKKGGIPQITRVNKQNKKLIEFDPVVKEAAKKELKEEDVSEDDKWPKIEIKELYKLKTPMFTFFPADTYINGKDNLYTQEEVRNVMSNYIRERNLNEKKNVELDENMKPLFWEDKPDNVGPKYVITREELFKRIDKYLSPYYMVTDLQTKEEDIKGGTFRGIAMVAEKSHNKNITRISGLEVFKFNINNLVNKFQLKYACSVSTQTFKEKTSEKTEVTVHGNFIEEIAQYFVEECKINKKYIHMTNKLGKKKKDNTSKNVIKA